MEMFPLSPFQEALLLSPFPSGMRIQGGHMFRPEYPPSPVRVELALPGGEQQAVVHRLSRNPAAVAPEARLFQALAGLGLPVPAAIDAELPLAGATTVPGGGTAARARHRRHSNAAGLF
ncbi:MAG: hypothetical protein ACR2JY_02410 [Chloroflexota bacterium]